MKKRSMGDQHPKHPRGLRSAADNPAPEEQHRLLTEGLSSLNIAVDASRIDHLLTYARELQRWNAKINLVGKAGLASILETHFLDSLTLALAFDLAAPEPSRIKLLDVGSGAGFPGLVIKTAFPQIQTTLVEPRGKRVSFLNHIVRTLSLLNITILNDRLEPDKTPPSLQSACNMVTCRALTDIASFIPMVSPCLVHKGIVVVLKGPKGDQERQAIDATLRREQFSIITTIETALPFSKASRRLIVFQKNA